MMVVLRKKEDMSMYGVMMVVKSIGVILIMFVVAAMVKKLCKGIKTKNKRAQTLLTLLASTIHYFCALAGIIWILTIFEVNVNTIFASVGIVALIVGFSAESLIADVVTGIFMIFENQYNVGDVIEIDGYRGEVSQIGIRTMNIKDSGDNIKIFNNSNISNIVNLSLSDSKAVCDVRISYDEDLEHVEEVLKNILKECYEENHEIFLSIPVYAGVQNLTDTAVVLRITANVKEENIFEGKRLLNRALILGFKKNHIQLSGQRMLQSAKA